MVERENREGNTGARERDDQVSIFAFLFLVRVIDISCAVELRLCPLGQGMCSAETFKVRTFGVPRARRLLVYSSYSQRGSEKR